MNPAETKLRLLVTVPVEVTGAYSYLDDLVAKDDSLLGRILASVAEAVAHAVSHGQREGHVHDLQDLICVARNGPVTVALVSNPGSDDGFLTVRRMRAAEADLDNRFSRSAFSTVEHGWGGGGDTLVKKVRWAEKGDEDGRKGTVTYTFAPGTAEIVHTGEE